MTEECGVHRQLISYIDYNDLKVCILSYKHHVSLMSTRSWFHFVMGKEKMGKVNPRQNSGAGS